MLSLRVIEPLDVVEHIGTRVSAGLLDFAGRALGFQRGEDAAGEFVPLDIEPDMTRIPRWLAIAAFSFMLIIVGILLFAIGDNGLLDWLSVAQATVVALVRTHPTAAAAAYVIFVTAGTLTPVPSAILVMLLGGYLFGTLAGGLLSAAGATLSAGLVHLVGRALLSGLVTRLMADRLVTMQQAMRSNALGYLLAIRLLPGMPAWIANLAPVPFPVPLSTVLVATFAGILPICVLTANVGSGLASLAEIADRSATYVLRQPQLLLPLVALFLLAVVPIAVRKWRPASPGLDVDGGKEVNDPQRQVTPAANPGISNMSSAAPPSAVDCGERQPRTPIASGATSSPLPEACRAGAAGAQVAASARLAPRR